ncbi:MAG: L-2-amino-thiazoline-4-carboxylic acid hydrolase [Candidatus Micrarchaeota archaeon]
MEELELERKYVEERVCILKALRKHFGDDVVEIAAQAKKELIARRIREQYAGEIPVDLRRFFEIIFGDFEGIERIIEFEVVKQSERELEVRIKRCWYAEIYRALGAADIGEKLVCDMDPAMNRALNPRIVMERPKKLMNGDECCVFRYKLA